MFDEPNLYEDPECAEWAEQNDAETEDFINRALGEEPPF